MNPPILQPYRDIAPRLADTVFIAAGAAVVGDVEIGDHSSVWYNAVLRGDDHYIRIGTWTNIQDASVVHVQIMTNPTIIGHYVTVGHRAVLHACTIGDNCLIGMGAIVLTGTVIGDNCIIGAGALIPENRQIPPRSLVLGTPGKVVRELTDEDIALIRLSAEHYGHLATEYKTAFHCP